MSLAWAYGRLGMQNKTGGVSADTVCIRGHAPFQQYGCDVTCPRRADLRIHAHSRAARIARLVIEEKFQYLEEGEANSGPRRSRYCMPRVEHGLSLAGVDLIERKIRQTKAEKDMCRSININCKASDRPPWFYGAFASRGWHTAPPDACRREICALRPSCAVIYEQQQRSYLRANKALHGPRNLHAIQNLQQTPAVLNHSQT